MKHKLTFLVAFLARFLLRFLHKCQTSSPCLVASFLIYALICMLASVVTHSKPISLKDILAWSSNSMNPSFSAIGEEEHCAVSLVRLCVTRPVTYVFNQIIPHKLHTQIHTYLYTQYISTHTHIYIYIYIYVCVCVCIYVCICMQCMFMYSMYAYVYTCIYRHMYIDMYMYLNIYMQKNRDNFVETIYGIHLLLADLRTTTPLSFQQPYRVKKCVSAVSGTISWAVKPGISGNMSSAT